MRYYLSILENVINFAALNQHKYREHERTNTDLDFAYC